MYPLSYMVGLSNFSKGAWFEPSPPEKIKLMLHLLKIRKGDSAVDIGSGDGSIVMALAAAGANATGIEKDQKLINISNEKIAKSNLTANAQIIKEDLWHHNYSPYQKVALFQFKSVMKALEKKLQEELPLGALVASNYWQFPTWNPIQQKDGIYLYRKD